MHWSVIINPQKDKASIEGVQRCVFVRIDEKVVKMTDFSSIQKKKVGHLVNIRPRI